MPTKPKSNTEVAVQPAPHLPYIKVIIIAAAVGLLSAVAGTVLYNLVLSKILPSIVVQQSRQVVVDQQSAVIAVTKKVGPSVVSIVSSSTQLDPYSGSSQLQETGAGTGMIVSADGLILTNKHVVSDGDTFTVVTSDNKQYKNARVVAKDPTNDVALVKVEARGLTPVVLGDSDKVEVGQTVVAIGNALGQFQNSVTTGVISGKSRPITASNGGGSSERLTGLFQTDAAINPGNSGGPLVDIDGAVIGMNTAVSGGGQNIGFAIPINDARADLESYLTKGRISRAYIGVRYVPINQQVASANNLSVTQGALVYGSSSQAAVLPGSPAAKAGLRSGDIIVKFNGQPVTDAMPLSAFVGKQKPGDTITLTLLRDGKNLDVKVTLQEAPNS